MTKRLLALLLLIFVLLPSCSDAVLESEKPATPKPAGPRKDLLAGLLVKGSSALLEKTIQSMRGKPIVVNYWASWCGPCNREMPEMVTAAARFRNDVQFLGVDVEDHESLARGFLSAYNVRYKSLTMSRDEATSAQGLRGMPMTQFYDAAGALASVHHGEISGEVLDDRIQALLR